MTNSATTKRPAPTAPRPYQFPRFIRRTLENGIGVIVAPVPKLPVVTALAVVEAGATAEPRGKEGVAALTARGMLEGTIDLDGLELADQFERIGASIEARASWDLTAISLTTLSKRLPDALSLVRDILRAPSFPDREIQRLKEERLAELLQESADPRSLADEHFARAVYDPNARYALPEEGNTASIRTLTRDDVVAFHAKRFQPQGITVIFAGDIAIDDAAPLIERLFGDWRGVAAAGPPRGIDQPQTGRALRVVSKADAPQSELRIGHVGPPRTSPDYFDAMVMNAILGGLFSSRINLNLREKNGYTYGAFSAFEWRRGAGPFVVSTAVKSDVTALAVKEILNEIERMRTEEIGEDELTLATSYLDGVFPIRYETTASIATALANLVNYGLSEDFYDTYRVNVRNVTTKSVLRAAQQHLHPDALRTVVAGDASIVAEPLATVLGLAPEIVNADVPESTR